MGQYTKLKNIDEIPNNIASKLLENDNLCKLLKFNVSNALELSITEEEKNELLNSEDETKLRMFFDPFINKTIQEEKSELRIFESEFDIQNNLISNIFISFEIIVNNKISKLNNGKRRRIAILREILESLNGVEVKGIGLLHLPSKYPCRIRYYNDYFIGYQLTMYVSST